MELKLLLAVFLVIVVLFICILRLKLPAFLALLISSILVGLMSGLSPLLVMDSIKEGMGSTLGFVAVVVGLGAMMGAILEYTGSAKVLSERILHKFGDDKASWALMLIGFIIAIPVFFDIAFIIMVPMLYALQKRSGKSLLYFAFPLLASLIIAHAFIPPTPGPIAVADILKCDLGLVILYGIIIGLPTAALCGPIYGKYISQKMDIKAPEMEVEEHHELPISVGSVLMIIFLPILLILFQTILNRIPSVAEQLPETVMNFIDLVGHPFGALILANLLAWYLLGRKHGIESESLLKISNKSFEKAGIIILLTGAGGVFKQILVDTGIGEMLAANVADSRLSLLPIGFLTAVLIRLLQGSTTVAMIASAGLIAPIVGADISPEMLALLVLSIASGAVTTSHVNDSGFWLVSQYLGLTETQTLRSWTMMTTLIAIISFIFIMILSLFIT